MLGPIILLLLTSEGRCFGKPEAELELDAYYTAASVTVPFAEEGLEAAQEKQEIFTYLDMLRKAFIPKFVLAEASVNPLPVTGWLIHKNFRDFYGRAQVTPSLNLVEAATAGFEEPYALALFLGNVVEFSEKTSVIGHSRKGYVGYLASYGNYHLMHNQAVPDNWVEVEAKIKGDQKSERRKMSFSFRGGRKFHSNEEVMDTWYLGIRRSRVDFQKTWSAFFASTAIEYRLDFSTHRARAVSHFLLAEKNFPLRGGKMTLSVGLGYLWRSPIKYSGSLAGPSEAADSQVLLRPNLKF